MNLPGNLKETPSPVYLNQGRLIKFLFNSITRITLRAPLGRFDFRLAVLNKLSWDLEDFITQCCRYHYRNAKDIYLFVSLGILAYLTLHLHLLAGAISNIDISMPATVEKC